MLLTAHNLIAVIKAIDLFLILNPVLTAVLAKLLYTVKNFTLQSSYNYTKTWKKNMIRPPPLPSRFPRSLCALFLLLCTWNIWFTNLNRLNHLNNKITMPSVACLKADLKLLYGSFEDLREFSLKSFFRIYFWFFPNILYILGVQLVFGGFISNHRNA